MSVLAAGERQEVLVMVKNPFPRPETARVELVIPAGWSAEPPWREITVDGRSETTVSFTFTPDGVPVRRARIAVELEVGGYAFGQQAEALVSVE
jgi:hypothetical protein